MDGQALVTLAAVLVGGEMDGRLSAVEPIVELTVGDELVACPFSTLSETGSINSTVGGPAVVVRHTLGARSAPDSAICGTGQPLFSSTQSMVRR